MASGSLLYVPLGEERSPSNRSQEGTSRRRMIRIDHHHATAAWRTSVSKVDASLMRVNSETDGSAPLRWPRCIVSVVHLRPS
jgi:hypothetical protein